MYSLKLWSKWRIMKKEKDQHNFNIRASNNERRVGGLFFKEKLFYAYAHEVRKKKILANPSKIIRILLNISMSGK